MQTSQSAQVRRPWLLRKPSCACSRDRHAPHVSPSGTRAHTRCSSWDRRNSPGRRRPTPAPSCRRAPPLEVQRRATKCSADPIFAGARAPVVGRLSRAGERRARRPRSSQDGLGVAGSAELHGTSRLIGSPAGSRQPQPSRGRARAAVARLARLPRRRRPLLSRRAARSRSRAFRLRRRRRAAVLPRPPDLAALRRPPRGAAEELPPGAAAVVRNTLRSVGLASLAGC